MAALRTDGWDRAYGARNGGGDRVELFFDGWLGLTTMLGGVLRSTARDALSMLSRATQSTFSRRIVNHGRVTTGVHTWYMICTSSCMPSVILELDWCIPIEITYSVPVTQGSLMLCWNLGRLGSFCQQVAIRSLAHVFTRHLVWVYYVRQIQHLVGMLEYLLKFHGWRSAKTDGLSVPEGLTGFIGVLTKDGMIVGLGHGFLNKYLVQRRSRRRCFGDGHQRKKRSSGSRKHKCYSENYEKHHAIICTSCPTLWKHIVDYVAGASRNYDDTNGRFGNLRFHKELTHLWVLLLMDQAAACDFFVQL